MLTHLIDEKRFSFHYFLNCLSYIKEFVHGDFGRTKPNLTSLLGADCDILELDVQVSATSYQLVLERYRIVLLALVSYRFMLRHVVIIIVIIIVSKLQISVACYQNSNILNKSENATLQLSIFYEKVLDKK